MVTNSRIMHAVCVSYMEGVVMLSTIRDQRDATGRAQSAARNHCATTYHALSYALTPEPTHEQLIPSTSRPTQLSRPATVYRGHKAAAYAPSVTGSVCPTPSLVSQLSLAHAARKAQPPTGECSPPPGPGSPSHHQAALPPARSLARHTTLPRWRAGSVGDVDVGRGVAVRCTWEHAVRQGC